ncbi:MAG: DUF1232 domain-containing protein [Gemmatimonadota bacterium]
MRDFTNVVRENVSDYRGWFDVVRWAPIFAATLLVLANDPRLQHRHRQWVNAAIAYFVTPDDVLSEEAHGAYGYLDDIFVSAYVSDRIAREVGWSVIDEAWKGDLPARDIARSVLEREQELLGDQGEEALRSAGLLGPEIASAPDPDSA